MKHTCKTRVFHAKLDVLKQELFKKEIFGSVAAYTYVIEFQKRDLPHAHFLITLKPSSKLYSTDSYDKIVSAKIPNETKNRHLFNMVRRHMIHGPYGKKIQTISVCKGNIRKNAETAIRSHLLIKPFMEIMHTPLIKEGTMDAK